jgi:hypothetical protein
VALVRKRTIPTERPPLVDEVSANFCEQRVLCGQYNRSILGFLDREYFASAVRCDDKRGGICVIQTPGKISSSYSKCLSNLFTLQNKLTWIADFRLYLEFLNVFHINCRERGSVASRVTMLQARRSRVRFPRSLNFVFQFT